MVSVSLCTIYSFILLIFNEKNELIFFVLHLFYSFIHFFTFNYTLCTQIISTDTQRPARNPAVAQNPIGVVTPSVEVFNRFGGDDDTDVSSAAVCYQF